MDDGGAYAHAARVCRGAAVSSVSSVAAIAVIHVAVVHLAVFHVVEVDGGRVGREMRCLRDGRGANVQRRLG